MEKDYLIDKYINRKLSLQEEQRLNKIIEQSPDIKEEIDELEMLSQGIKYDVLKKKMNKLKDLEANQTRKVITLFSLKNISIAASILLLASAGLWPVYKKNSPENLYMKYYEKFPVIEISRSTDNSNGSGEYLEALNAYSKDDYSKATEIFRNSEITKAKFYEGISFMNLNSYDEAIRSFKDYLAIEELKDALPANYYIALCYLKLNERKKTKKYLLLVKKENSEYYFNKAQKLLSLIQV